MFDNWVYECRFLGLVFLMQMHDEHMSLTTEELKDNHEKLMRDAMTTVNKNLKMNVAIDCSVEFGPNYAEVH